MWKNVQINKQNVKVETDKAVLIAMPHNSKYDGFSFWHPSKLVRNGKNSYAISIGYTEEFTFKLIKYGQGKWNQRDIIKEIIIDAKEFEKAFEVMSDNLVAPKREEVLK